MGALVHLLGVESVQPLWKCLVVLQKVECRIAL